MTDNQPPSNNGREPHFPDDHPFADLFDEENSVVEPTAPTGGAVQAPTAGATASVSAQPETRREARERAAAEAAAQASAAQVTAAQVTAAQAAAAQTPASQAAADRSPVVLPADPVTASAPRPTVPAAEQPTSPHPAVTQPAVTQPAATQPAATQPPITPPEQRPAASDQPPTAPFTVIPEVDTNSPGRLGAAPQHTAATPAVSAAAATPAESVFNFGPSHTEDVAAPPVAGGGSGQGAGGFATPPQPQKQPKPGRQRRVITRIIVTVVIVGLLGGAGAFLYSTFGSQVQSLLAGPESTDYEGTGTGEVMFTIADGDFGEAIASNLERDGIIKSAGTFYSLLLNQNPQPVFQIGTYKLASKMSAESALTALTDPASKVDLRVTFPEGMVAADILAKLAETTGMPLADFEAAAADYTSFGLPAEAPRIEGYLFPATYDFQPGQTPTQILQAMVNRTFQSLDAAGVAPEDRHRVLTLAALIQKEAGAIPGDFAKVSRVFTNRLDIGMLLQSDATVAYGSGQTHRVETTEAERGDPNLYNTYVNPGLPIGPISNPGDAAIEAALHPADGPWLFFVTWNLETGETIFSVTGEEHEAAVAQWQQWMKEHPEYE